MLLAACSSLLMSSKLPPVLRLADRVVHLLLSQPDASGLDLASLDVLCDWNLSSSKVGTGAGCATGYSPEAFTNGATNSVEATPVSSNFIQTFVKALDSLSPGLLNWNSELGHLDAASRITPSTLNARLQELDYGLQLVERLGPASAEVTSLPGSLRHLPPQASTHLSALKAALNDVEGVVGAAAFRLAVLCCSRGSLRGPVEAALADPVNSATSAGLSLSDADFFRDLAALARFSTAFKRCVSDLDRCRRSHGKHPTASQGTSCHRRNSHRRPHDSRGNKNAGEQSRERGHHRRHGTRQLNADGIMDDILAKLGSEPLYADVHKKASSRDF